MYFIINLNSNVLNFILCFCIDNFLFYFICIKWDFIIICWFDVFIFKNRSECGFILFKRNLLHEINICVDLLK